MCCQGVLIEEKKDGELDAQEAGGSGSSAVGGADGARRRVARRQVPAASGATAPSVPGSARAPAPDTGRSRGSGTSGFAQTTLFAWCADTTHFRCTVCQEQPPTSDVRGCDGTSTELFDDRTIHCPLSGSSLNVALPRHGSPFTVSFCITRSCRRPCRRSAQSTSPSGARSLVMSRHCHVTPRHRHANFVTGMMWQ